jgi:KDO2-lipid IV(A) lauroyltransferase
VNTVVQKYTVKVADLDALTRHLFLKFNTESLMLRIFGPLFASAVFRSLAFLPLSCLQRMGVFCGWLVWCLPGSYKRSAAANLKQAFPESDQTLLKAAMLSVGTIFLEMPYWWVRRNDIELNRQVYCADWEQFETALARNKGVILLSPHAGCFELLGPIYSSRHRSTVLFRPPRMAWLQKWIIDMRSRKLLTMAPANQSGVRTLVKTLKRGNTIGILPDQVPVEGEGVWAPFFGRPAYTMTLVQRLQSLSGATIFILGAKRNAIGKGFTIHTKELSEPLPDDPVQAATIINQEMEAIIRLMPDQYLWGYNRYRQPRVK